MRWPLLFITLIISTGYTDVMAQNAEIGEKDFGDFFGRTFPDFRFDNYHGQTISPLFELELRSSINDSWPEHTWELERFFRGPYLSRLAFTADDLIFSYPLLRYAYRILAFSYLYEAQYFLGQDLKRMNLPMKSCHFSSMAINPVSTEMRQFIQRLKWLETGTEFSLPAEHSYKKFEEEWVKKLGSSEASELSLSQQIFKQQCLSLFTCYPVKGEKIQEILQQTCAHYQDVMNEIGNEKDSIYGLAASNLAYDLITNSEMMTIFTRGIGSALLKNFRELYAHKEMGTNELIKIIPLIFMEINRGEEKKGSALQGRPFIIGALKSLDDKGVKNLFLPNTPTPTPTTVMTPTPLATLPYIAKATPTPKIYKEPRIVSTPVPTALATPIPIKKSAFWVAKEVREKFDFKRSKVDMLKFKYDFTFSLKAKEKLKGPMKLYMSRDGLMSMKTKDKLGSKEMPFNLLFLKYMLDEGEHQGLFNVQAVLGQKFYVTNDLDKNEDGAISYIELQNDESTNYIWQIQILKGP